MSRNEIVTASTDSSLRLWSIAPAEAGVQPAAGGGLFGPALAGEGAAHCTRVFSGHANERNFVGLAVDGQFIACGSETNEAFVYFKAISTPSMVFSLSPQPYCANGGEDTELAGRPSGRADQQHRAAAATAPGGGGFVSAVRWRSASHTLLVANSLGRLCVLKMKPLGDATNGL